MEREADRKIAAELAEALGNIPLALEQAGAYTARSGLSLSEYTELFRKRQQEHAPRTAGPESYPAALGITFDLAFQRVASESAAAVELLNLCAFLAPDEIPLEIFKEASEVLPPSIAAVADNPEALGNLATILQDYALVKVRGGSYLSFHHFVQATARDRLPLEERKTWAADAVRLMNVAFVFDGNNVQTWPACARLLQHALTAIEHDRETQGAQESVSTLLNKIGAYLIHNAEFVRAKAVLERSLQIEEVLNGPNHPRVAIRANNLGEALRGMGDLDGAQANYERALAIDEAAYGQNHYIIAIRHNNLGLVLEQKGDLESAKANLERALAIDEESYGPSHPEVATDLSNLCAVLRKQGNLDRARVLSQRALAIDEKSYGAVHPNVAIRANNLGMVLKEQGDLVGARANFERALRIFREFLGDQHPHTLIVERNLKNL